MVPPNPLFFSIFPHVQWLVSWGYILLGFDPEKIGWEAAVGWAHHCQPLTKG